MTIADKLRLIANNVQKVFESGKKAEYDAFWDEYLKDHSGQFMFAGEGWERENCKPPRGTVIQPTYPYMMFAGNRMGDLVTWAEENEITIDFSKARSVNYLFYKSSLGRITHVGEINTTNASSIMYTFQNEQLHTIDHLILKDDGSQTFTQPFGGAYALENITISGVIGQNGFELRHCTKLTVKSLRSVLKALSKDSAIASGKSITLAIVHQAIIESDAECIEYATAAKNAGWTIAYN